MKPMLEKARMLTENVTPLKKNCGKLCGAACCQNDESGENGMLLFPGEEEAYAQPIQNFPFHLVEDDTLFPGGKRLVCEGVCQREHRPLACRIFPLRMALSLKEGTYTVLPEIDPRAWAVCPLPEECGMRGMSADFVSAVQKAGESLILDAECLVALEQEQRIIDEMRQF